MTKLSHAKEQSLNKYLQFTKYVHHMFFDMYLYACATDDTANQCADNL